MTREEHYRKAEELDALVEKDVADGFLILAKINTMRALTHATLANCRIKEVDHD